MCLPFFAESCLCKTEQVLNTDEVDEGVTNITTYEMQEIRQESEHDDSSGIPFWKSILRYKKSIPRGQTLPIYAVKSASDILLGIFLIITVERVSPPSPILAKLSWLRSLTPAVRRPPEAASLELEGTEDSC